MKLTAFPLALALFALSGLSLASDALEVIELDASVPEAPGLQLTWSCDVLVPSPMMRYRPTSCRNSQARDIEPEAARELRVEHVEIESVH